MAQQYMGHYDQWLEYEIENLQKDVAWESFPVPQLGETNPLAFSKSKESFGISRIPPHLQLQYGFASQSMDFPLPGMASKNVSSYSSIYPLSAQLPLILASLSGMR
jgi:hypothetical protein